MSINAFPAEGGCDCRAVRFRLQTAPLIEAYQASLRA